MTEQQYPTRAQVDAAVAAWVANRKGNQIDLSNVAALKDRLHALFPQPTPSAEPPIERCLSGDMHAAHEWGGHPGQPGTGYRCPGIAAAPPSIADMAPGTRFIGRTRDGVLSSTDRVWMVAELGYVFSTGNHLLIDERIDPYTIRDVTPPPATPEGGVDAG